MTTYVFSSNPVLKRQYFSPVISRILFIISFLVFAAPLWGQELNGIWKGTLTQQPGGCFPEYHVELQVNISNNQVTGSCYHYSDVRNYVKKNYMGSFNANSKTISIQELRITAFHIPPDCTPCIRYFNLTYSKNGAQETLSGDWGGYVMNGIAACTPGQITLQRVKKSDFEHIQEIKVDTGLIQLEFFDNAEIDGDSISILLDNNVLVSNQLLGLKPVSVDVKIDFNHMEREITMVAENLGRISPNTALLIVKTNGKRYRLFLSSDKQKNAQVRFVYEKPDN